MISDFTEGVRLPHVNSLHPSVPIASIGHALARELDDTIVAPLPESIAAALRKLEEQDSSRRRGGF